MTKKNFWQFSTKALEVCSSNILKIPSLPAKLVISYERSVRRQQTSCIVTSYICNV